MKIALVFYGKFTGVNKRHETQGFEVPCEFLYQNVVNEKTDIFFHGWDDEEHKSLELIQKLKPKKYLLEKQIVFEHPYKHYDFVQGAWNTKDYMNNNYSRFYSLKQAMSLVDESYDMVLVSRFDTIFYTPIPFEKFSKDNFYVTNWQYNKDGYGFNDAWFISGYENMKNFSLIYDVFDEYNKLDSKYVEFLTSHGLSVNNITSGHAIFRYRSEEIGLKNKTYTWGDEYLTWGLIRRHELRKSVESNLSILNIEKL
jgi:hypothetical protein